MYIQPGVMCLMISIQIQGEVMRWLAPCLIKRAGEHGRLSVDVPHRFTKQNSFEEAHTYCKCNIAHRAPITAAFDKYIRTVVLKQSKTPQRILWIGLHIGMGPANDIT